VFAVPDDAFVVQKMQGDTRVAFKPGRKMYAAQLKSLTAYYIPYACLTFFRKAPSGTLPPISQERHWGKRASDAFFITNIKHAFTAF
jgi:hypothetical protein